MSNDYRNSEGYPDPTAGEALSRIAANEKQFLRAFRPIVYICSPFSGDVNKVTETTALIHFAEKSAMLQEFDKDLFDRYVKRIIVHSRNDIRFELKCGLTLRERK